MGPRLDSRGRETLSRKEVVLVVLQWGRGWTAAEGSFLPDQWSRVEWLQWGRGWTAAEGSFIWCASRTLLCFNGAAAGQPRKALERR